MALQIEVTRVSVINKGDQFKNDFHTITMNLKMLDDAKEVINKSFSIDYKQVQILSDRLAEIEKQMDSEITKYKIEKAIFDQLAVEATKIQVSLSAKEV